ncbi:MAG: hypothetical protein A4E66_02565 [Syntrophus sp. PtaB.Bin001]|nr:MAG: hypothetical protein A4E66_02565 [Syntrophus sp. PtaB.Bin001]
MINHPFPPKSSKNNESQMNGLRMKRRNEKQGTFIIGISIMVFILCLMTACATTDPSNKRKPTSNLPESLSFIDSFNEDTKLFDEGLTSLKTTPERAPDYAGARIFFETLVRNHPESKWRIQAELWLDQLTAFSRLEEQLKTCQKKEEEGRAAQSRLQRENEQLQREIRQLNEKNQQELNRVNQENEDLKRDIQLLKNMEIQREKRERMLR